jgi:hypothetical protein
MKAKKVMRDEYGSFSTIAPRFPIFSTANMPRGFPMLKLNRLFYTSVVQSRK